MLSGAEAGSRGRILSRKRPQMVAIPEEHEMCEFQVVHIWIRCSFTCAFNLRNLRYVNGLSGRWILLWFVWRRNCDNAVLAWLRTSELLFEREELYDFNIGDNKKNCMYLSGLFSEFMLHNC